MKAFSVAERTPDAFRGSSRRNQGPRSIVSRHEGNVMAKSENGRIVETPTEARQAEPGPNVLLVLAISTIVAIGVLTCVWIVFFRT
jgi:hypothetical protein